MYREIFHKIVKIWLFIFPHEFYIVVKDLIELKLVVSKSDHCMKIKLVKLSQSECVLSKCV